MKLNFDFHFLSSEYGDYHDEPNNMQFEESHPELQEISQQMPDPAGLSCRVMQLLTGRVFCMVT